MVNQDFQKFNEIQQKHKSIYVGSNQNSQRGLNDPNYNNANETDKLPGATGYTKK